MNASTYFMEKESELYKFVKSSTNIKNRVISFNGIGLEETKQFTLSELRLFIERDIFLAIRKGELPELEFQFQIQKSSEAYRSINLLITKVTGEVVNNKFLQDEYLKNALNFLDKEFIEKNHEILYSDYGHKILFKIAQILWKYNSERVLFKNGELVFLKRRFFQLIDYSQGLLKSQLDQLAQGSKIENINTKEVSYA